MERRPIQYAAGTLAASAFVTVTQILTGAVLDCALRIALALFATMIPLQVVVFFTPVPGLPKDGIFPWTEIVYWRLQQYSTALILLGFAATFWHLAWWLGPLFAGASAIAYWTYRWWANSGDFN